MTKRRQHVIKELDLSEISAVDNPAQVHARATIMKRGGPPKGGKDCPECDGEGCDECNQTGVMNVSGKEKPMSDEYAKKIADLEAKVTDLTKRLTDAEAAVTKSAAEVAKKDAEIADVKKAKEAVEKDEIVKVGDEEVRKSIVGEASFKVIKAQQAQIVTEIGKREMVELEKRAETDFPHLPGKATEKATVLKALNTMGEETRKTLETMLKAGEAAMAKSFKETGHSFEGSNDSPSVKLEKYVQAYAADKKVEIGKAHVDLGQDAEYRKLYNEAYGQKKAA